jgi:hypothetical protein
MKGFASLSESAMAGSDETLDFERDGGLELAFCSTTSERDVAGEFAKGGVILGFELSSTTRGACVTWLSQYPGEAEWLLPPSTMLTPRRHLEHDGSNKKIERVKLAMGDKIEVLPTKGRGQSIVKEGGEGRITRVIYEVKFDCSGEEASRVDEVDESLIKDLPIQVLSFVATVRVPFAELNLSVPDIASAVVTPAAGAKVELKSKGQIEKVNLWRTVWVATSKDGVKSETPKEIEGSQSELKVCEWSDIKDRRELRDITYDVLLADGTTKKDDFHFSSITLTHGRSLGRPNDPNFFFDIPKLPDTERRGFGSAPVGKGPLLPVRISNREVHGSELDYTVRISNRDMCSRNLSAGDPVVVDEGKEFKLRLQLGRVGAGMKALECGFFGGCGRSGAIAMSMWGVMCIVLGMPFATAVFTNNAVPSNLGLLGSYGMTLYFAVFSIMGFWRAGVFLMLMHHQGKTLLPCCQPEMYDHNQSIRASQSEVLKRDVEHIATIHKWERRAVDSLPRLLNAAPVGCIFVVCGVAVDTVISGFNGSYWRSEVCYLLAVGVVFGAVARAVKGRGKRLAQSIFMYAIFLCSTGLFLRNLQKLIPTGGAFALECNENNCFTEWGYVVGGLAGAVWGGRSILARRRADKDAAVKVAQDSKKYGKVFQTMKEAGGAAQLANINKVKFLTNHFVHLVVSLISCIPLQPNLAPLCRCFNEKRRHCVRALEQEKARVQESRTVRWYFHGKPLRSSTSMELRVPADRYQPRRQVRLPTRSAERA